MLFMGTGSREDMLEKARQIEIDQIVIDWEDAVAPDQKQRARDFTLASLASPGKHPRSQYALMV